MHKWPTVMRDDTEWQRLTALHVELLNPPAPYDAVYVLLAAHGRQVDGRDTVSATGHRQETLKLTASSTRWPVVGPAPRSDTRLCAVEAEREAVDIRLVDRMKSIDEMTSVQKAVLKICPAKCHGSRLACCRSAKRRASRRL